MVAADVRSFARANLPSPPARILEIGAGAGGLARSLSVAGYSVLAIDPEPAGTNVVAAHLHDLDQPRASFDAALAIVSLHHVNPLAPSCRQLASLLKPGAPFLVDEFDVYRFDREAARWWLDQRRALGEVEEATAEELVDEHRAHLHPLERIIETLRPYFDLGLPVRGAWLYRWALNESLRAAEEELIAQGRLPAAGARLVARRRRDVRNTHVVAEVIGDRV